MLKTERYFANGINAENCLCCEYLVESAAVPFLSLRHPRESPDHNWSPTLYWPWLPAMVSCTAVYNQAWIFLSLLFVEVPFYPQFLSWSSRAALLLHLIDTYSSLSSNHNPNRQQLSCTNVQRNRISPRWRLPSSSIAMSTSSIFKT
jgi:hypothetical protein